MVEDDEEQISETGYSPGLTSRESKIGTIHLKSSHSTEQPKIHGSLSFTTTTGPTIEPPTEPATSPFNRPISPSVAIPCDPVKQATSRGDCGAAATVRPPHAITAPLPLFEQYHDQGGSASDKEEDWEIKKVVDKRRVAKGNEYKVRWRDTWLPESELGKAQELLREFEAKGRVGHWRKQGRPVRTGRV